MNRVEVRDSRSEHVGMNGAKVSDRRPEGEGGRASVWARLPIRVKGMVVVSLPLIALFVTSTAFVLVDTSNRDTADAVARSVIVQRELDAVLQIAVDEETGARGFVLTDDPSFLTPLREAEDRLPAQLDTVDRLIAGNDELVATFARVRDRLDRRVQISKEMIENPIGPGGANDRLRATLDEGKHTTDAIRDDIASMHRMQDRILDDAQRAARESADRSRIVVLGAAFLGLVGAIVANAVFARGVARRVAFVAGNAARLARDESLEPAPAGGDEVAALALALERAATLLAERRRDLEETRSFLQHLIASGPMVMFAGTLVLPSEDGSVEPGMTFTYVSDNAERLLGVEQHELMGDVAPFIERVHPDDLDATIAMFADAVATGADTLHEHRFIHRDGNIRWLRNVVRVVPGDPPRLLGYALDVTDRRLAEEAVDRSRATLQAIVDESPDVITIIEVDGRIRSASPAARELLGFEPEDIVDTMVGRYIDPADRDEVFGRFARLVTGEDDQLRVRFRARHRDGSWSIVDARAHAMLDDDGTPAAVIAILRDASAQLELEQSLRDASEQAERASQAKSEFLSRMSHELRTPLNSVLGFGQLLALDELTPDQHENVTDILRAGRHLLALIDEVLDIARIEAGGMNLSLENVDLDEVVENAIALTRSQATARQIGIVPPAIKRGEVQVMADRQRFLQILLNLLSNAVKYNRDGGRITIVAERFDRAPERPDGSAAAAADPTGGGWVRVSVSDTGIGIPTDRLEDAFAPFERLGADQTDIEGSGVGLALSRAMTQRMGGSLTVESTPGVGSTFHLELPLGVPASDELHDMEASSDSDGTGGPDDAGDSGDQGEPGLDGRRRPVAAPVARAADGTRTQVLHIEDNLANLTVVERMLARRGDIDVIPALQGGIGLDMARQHQPDIVLLDVHLPDMSGDEVLRRLRADPRTAGIPVIVISADATPGQIRRLRGEGADHYLTKPVDMLDLLSVLDEMISTARPPRRGPRSELLTREESS